MQPETTKMEQLLEKCLLIGQKDDNNLITKLVSIFWQTRNCCFGPLSAFIAGFVAQEILKGIT